ncbi:poly-beta-1,6-N-acetyl-D-glucosamine biosynthesis protein PgaD [Atlantibacter subterranea]|uniref:Poly-beta-1,6-N-acetyl-D-glucosamine biosynthesis protein PgaD n=1 Tax=Atlantibacter subterraneus TaxID=255519 RepID=A0A427V661_9ENTR|nr:poly-beta-1,6-N-acetyl-D-glucosamine biosynthesis protein PgaD [Atlantibacter subterranea]MDZ5665479.1 poly-beta-1,6-N-acetyl-D-glucosamine biosynthesis protein PgaD [Atlantibacter hermannii]MDA3134613.1 poly-beta-1,6-N-acetyl-D-glucosamine biosynthesis protein PgaD [Atlantibacter subterranea]MDV7022176.1 poly-beta-1,6-N-acetyl-D-glucosamine biosynthesis protein PgaD [Atlantibacter subterranea]MDW2743853.1 poly-beta-1,6-N-acetyl-D-glucosamine biosynthesis protein PgaD [Atlantibacter subterra
MEQPLIFTEQRKLPKFIDTVLTIAAWLGFGYLIYLGLVKALSENAFMGPRPFESTLVTLALYFLIALVNGLVLILWAKYNQLRFRVERRKRRPALAPKELAVSFHITPELVTELNKARVLTVHHNSMGGISYVDIKQGINDNLLPAPPLKLQMMPPPLRQTSPATL